MDYKSSINKTLADNIRTRRKELHMSQEKLAELSGLHRTYIGGIEQYTRNPSLKSVEKISKVLDIDPSIILNQHYNDISHCDYAICNFKDGQYNFHPINQKEIKPEVKDLLEKIFSK